MGCAVALKQKLMHGLQFVIASHACEQKIRMIDTKFSGALRHPEPPSCSDLKNAGKAWVPKTGQAHQICRLAQAALADALRRVQFDVLRANDLFYP
jgi:hypothetical protein